MNCQRCSSEKVTYIYAKCSDLFYAKFYTGREYQGYVPNVMGIGGGDGVEFEYCQDCGQIQGSFPGNFSTEEDIE